MKNIFTTIAIAVLINIFFYSKPLTKTHTDPVITDIKPTKVKNVRFATKAVKLDLKPLWDKSKFKKKEGEFIERFLETAKNEKEKFKIPVSIKIGQAILESRWGESRLSKNNNNYFGVKCFSKKCKKGHCSNFSDDHHKDFFINYPSPWLSWRAHSKVLEKSIYKDLKLLDIKDYKGWAYGLKKAGYATDPKYPEKLISIIEKYELYLLEG